MEIKELTKLLELPNKHFEGHLVLNDHKTIWTLYFVQGRLIYAADGGHPVRRWNRTLAEYFPQCRLNVDPDQLAAQSHWQIYLLDQGFKQQQFSLVRAKMMLRAVIQECLFELSQCTYAQCDYQPTELPISRFCRTIALSPWEVKMAVNKVKTGLSGRRMGMIAWRRDMSPVSPVSNSWSKEGIMECSSVWRELAKLSWWMAAM